MMFRRIARSLGLLTMMLGGVGAGFSQTSVNCGLSLPDGSTPRATSTGHTEPIAAGLPVLDVPSGAKVSPPVAGGARLRVTCINGGAAGSPTNPGVVGLTISLGVPITNTTASHPNVSTKIRLGNFVGDFTAANVSIFSMNHAGGSILIGLGTPTSFPTTGIIFSAGPSTSSFDLMGVLVSVNGRTGAIVASLTSTEGIFRSQDSGKLSRYVQGLDAIQWSWNRR
jgi:hypothetical protein